MNRILRAWLLASLLAAFSGLPGAWSAGTTNLLWRWSNPAPLGNNLADLAYLTNQPLVGVADTGQLITRTDASTWELADTGTRRWLRSAVWFNPNAVGGTPLLIVTGQEGTVLTSKNAVTFTRQDLGTTDWLEGVASSGSRLVAVGDQGALYSSETGTNWVRRDPGFNTWLRGVTYRPGGPFVAVGENGRIATSTDGVTWTTRTSGTTANLNRAGVFRVNNTDGVLVVGEGGTVLYSRDSQARNWTVANSGTTADLYVATQETRFNFFLPYGALIVAGDEAVRSAVFIGNSLLFSDETSAGRSFPAPLGSYYAGLSTGSELILGGRAGFLASGSRATQLSSAIDWSTPYSSPRNVLFAVAPNVAYGTNVSASLVSNAVVRTTRRTTNTFYVAVGNGPTILQSDNGASWSTALVPTNAAGQVLLALAAAPEAFIAVGSAGTLLRSPVAYSPLVTTNVFTNSLQQPVPVILTNAINTLGLTWEPLLSSVNTNLHGLDTDGQRWVAAGAGGRLIGSANGTQWSPLASPTASNLLSVAASPGRWLVTGEGGTILSSTDGLTFLIGNSGVTQRLNRGRWSGDRFVVVGDAGTILTSPDGLAWQTRNSGVTQHLQDVLQVAGTWYAVGQQGTVLGSFDAIQWHRLDTLTAKALYGLASTEGQLIAVGLDGAILRAQAGPYAAGVEFTQWPKAASESVFVLSGRLDQRFRLERSTNLVDWVLSDVIEIQDSSGSLLLVDDSVNDPNRQYFRTSSEP